MNGREIVFVFRNPNVASVGRRRLPLRGRGFFRDLSEYREAFGDDSEGIVGMEFLRSHVVQIDFDGGKVNFLKSSDAIAGQRLPLTFDQGCPAVAMDLPTVGTLQFMLDTGNVCFQNGTLSNATFEKLVQAGHLDVMDEIEILTRPMAPERFVSAHWSGNSWVNSAHEPAISEGSDNVLGVGYLARYTVTFDFPKNF